MGVTINESNIPIATDTRQIAVHYRKDPLIWALHGGEDYQLLFTVPTPKREQLHQLAATYSISIIGTITSQNQGINIHRTDNQLRPLSSTGYDAFTITSQR